MTVLPPPRRRRLWRLAGFALLAMVALAMVVAVRFRQVVATGELAKILCERLEEELGMPVTVGSASVRGLTRVTAAQLAMRPPAGEMPIEAQLLSIKFDGWSLLLGTLEPVTFELEGLELNLASAARRLELKRTLERIERQSHRFKPTIHVTLVRAELERGRFTGDRLTLERPRFGARAFRVQGIFEPPGTEPVAIVVRGVSTASPESVSLDLGLRSPWLELHAEGGLAGMSTTPKLRGEVRLDRLDAAVAARLAMPDTSPVRGGQVTGRLTLSGDAYSPAIEGDFSPKELLVELPEVGLSTVKSGSLDLGPGQALCRDLVVETKYGLFGVQGSVRGPLMDPTVSLRADCASFDLVPILEKRKLPATMEGGCSAVIGLEGKAKRPSVRAELDVRGLALDWPSEKIGGIPIRVVLAKVQYSGDALRAKDADVTVWKVPATAGIQIEGLSGSMRLAAEARAADVDLGRLAKNLPAPIRKALEQYRVQGRTAVTAEVAGSREDTTVVLDAPGAGLSLAVPLGTESLAVTLQGGRVTLARQTLYGSRLTGLVNGTPFAGDVAVTNLIDQPGVKGEVMLRRARLDKLVPAVASRYDVRGTPDLRVVLSESKETPYEVSAPAGGLSMSLAVEGGTKLPLAFEAGELRLAAGSLQGRRLAGALAGGSFHGELTVQSALSGTPRPVGKASLQRVWIEKLLPELARSYSVEGPIDADVTFDGSRVGLSCSLAGMRTRVPAGKSFVTLEFEGGRIDLADGGARMSKVALTLGGKGTIRLDGDATRGRMDLGLTAQGLEVGRLISAATGGESRSKRPLAFDGRIRTVHQSPLLTGRFVLGAEPAPATTASKLLDGSSGELSWDGTILKTQKLKVLGVPATLEMVRAPDGSRLNFEMKNAALETILEKSGAWAGIASGSADASFVIRSSQSDEGGFSGSGHVVIRQLIVRGEKVAKAAGIQNPSTKLRGAGGFLSLGFLPSFLSLPGQVAAGQLHMNAAYVDFAFADHDLGNLRWDAQLKGGRMAGPLSTSPDASHVSGHLALDLRQAFAEGSFGIADSNKGISMKVNPLLLDTRRSPPMWTPGGLKDFEFAGAGDAFNIVGTAGSAVLGGILRGGSAALGPASLVPMLFLGDKKPHRPYTGKPGERPSSAEATVRTTAEMLDRPRK